LASEWLSAVGLWGGALETRSGSTWLSIAGDAAGQESIILHTATDETTLERGIITEIRALGFVRSGTAVVLATSSDVSVFAVSPLAAHGGVSNPGDKNAATEKTIFEVSVDKGERHAVSTRSGVTISVPLGGKHAVRIYRKGEQIETIRFRFARDSTKKCLWYY